MLRTQNTNSINMANATQNEQFARELLTTYPLDQALSWIKSNMDIDDVYEAKEILQYIRENYDAEVVFDRKELEQWAEANGYVKEEED